MLKIKKIFIGLLISLFSFSTYAATLSQTVGFALGTVGSLGAYMGLAAAAPLAISGGVVVGALGLAIYLTDNLTSPTDTNTRISINLDPNTPLITPVGWTSPTQPPSLASPSTVYNISTPAMSNSDPVQLCQSYADYVHNTANPNITYSGITPNGDNYWCQGYNAGTQSVQNLVGLIKANSCPAGYSLNGSACDLTNASAVIKPISNRQEIKRVGNNFEADPQANPADKMPISNVDVQPSKVTVNGADGSKLEVTINQDGSTTVVQTAPSADNKTTTKKTIDLSPPDANNPPKVIGSKDETFNGVGTQASPTPSSGPQIDVSGLNKEGTQTQIKGILDNLKTNSDDIKNAITNADNNPTDLADKKTDYDNKAQAHSDKFAEIGTNGLDNHGVTWSWFPDIPASTCTTWQHNIGGYALTMNFCDGVSKARDIIGWIFYIITAMSLFNIFTGRRSA